MDRDAAILLLESQHTFPSEHHFHIIVRSQQEHIDSVVASLARFCDLVDLNGRVQPVPSRQGSYVSLRTTLPCNSAAMVLDIYAHLQSLPEVVRYL
jgi:putative lipoic acid-binding regulatory protein